jgi:hypothetical protein
MMGLSSLIWIGKHQATENDGEDANDRGLMAAKWQRN